MSAIHPLPGLDRPRHIYALGDVQGCFLTFQALLERISDPGQNSQPYDPDIDQLWLAGDLINRGPRSLDMLDWCLDHRERIRIVLGNHDCHLIFQAHGMRNPKPGDTLASILNHPNIESYVEWLGKQRFLLREDDYVMVHAGLWPTWSLSEAIEAADLLSQHVSHFGSHLGLFGRLKQHVCPSWEKAKTVEQRVATAMSILTTIRFVEHNHPDEKTKLRLNRGFKGSPSEAKELSEPHLKPWHQLFAWNRQKIDFTVIYGHWAAQGLSVLPQAIGLDTGCIWGHHLTALRLSDRRIWQQENVDC